MEMMKALGRDTKSFLMGFSRRDIRTLLIASLVVLGCVSCADFWVSATDQYDCKYSKKIDDWVCVNKKDLDKSAARI
ncbi:hypothetical protein [Pseudomonas paraeruginosa]|uniref:hypothetical protein n=1 Tax=Pseudomonas paraeruginosa TaxID=2994495 RepID=UPI0039FCC89A